MDRKAKAKEFMLKANNKYSEDERDGRRDRS